MTATTLDRCVVEDHDPAIACEASRCRSGDSATRRIRFACGCNCRWCMPCVTQMCDWLADWLRYCSHCKVTCENHPGFSLSMSNVSEFIVSVQPL